MFSPLPEKGIKFGQPYVLFQPIWIYNGKVNKDILFKYWENVSFKGSVGAAQVLNSQTQRAGSGLARCLSAISNPSPLLAS